MNITKLLLTDVAMAITAIAFLFLLKRKNLSVQSSIKDKLLKNTNNKLPEIEKLLELEKLAIREGNGIEHNSLLADWKFISVWKKITITKILFSVICLESSPQP